MQIATKHCGPTVNHRSLIQTQNLNEKKKIKKFLFIIHKRGQISI